MCAQRGHVYACLLGGKREGKGAEEGRAPAVHAGDLLVGALLLLPPLCKAALVDMVLANAARHHPCLQHAKELRALP